MWHWLLFISKFLTWTYILCIANSFMCCLIHHVLFFLPCDSYLISSWDILLLGDTWVTKLCVGVLAALRFQKQSFLSDTLLMAATEVGNSKRKYSTEPRISPPDQYWFTKLFALRRQKAFLSDFKLETWMVPGAKGEVTWWHKACILTSQTSRESFDVKFELCEPINFYPKIFFLLLLLARKVCRSPP